MVQMSKEDEKRELAAQFAENDRKGGKQDNLEERLGFGSKEGIKLEFFKKNCKFLAGCLPHIVERILRAHGLDIDSSNTYIDW